MTITAEAYIEGTETDPAIQAQGAVRQVQRRLTGALRPKVALLTELVDCAFRRHGLRSRWRRADRLPRERHDHPAMISG